MDIMFRNCFIKSGMHVFCSRCGKKLLQDRYNYLKHLETCDCSENNLSLKDEFSITPLPNHSRGYIFVRRGNVLYFHVYELQLWDRNRLRDHLRGHSNPFMDCLCEADPENLRPEDDPVPLAGVWKKVFTAVFKKNRTFVEKGDKSLKYWLTQEQSDTFMLPLSMSDPLRTIRDFFPGFTGTDIWSLLQMQFCIFPFRKKLSKRLYPPCILPDEAELRDDAAFLSADDLPTEELSFLAGHKNAAYITSVSIGGKHCLKVLCRTTANRASAPFIFIITGDHITSQMYFDLRDVMLLGPANTAPVHIAPGAFEAFSSAHPEMMLDRYTGRYPLLPLLAPYTRNCFELLCKAGLSRLADRILVDLPDSYTISSRLHLGKNSPAEIFSLPIRFLRKLEPLTDRHDFWTVFDKLRALYQVSPAFIDMDQYSKTYLSFITNLRISSGEEALGENMLRDAEHAFLEAGMTIRQSQLLKWLRYMLLLDQMYPDQDNYRYLLDYLHVCSEMRTFPYGLMPKDIKLAHDEAASLYQMNRDKIQMQKFRKSVAIPAYAHLSTEKDEKDPRSPLYGQPYAVLLPETPSDLEAESLQMHNCVKTYVSRVVQGTSRIVFLRSRSALHKSLVTMEISQRGELVQAKAFANRRVPKNIQDYIRLWAKTKGIRIHTTDVDAYAA